MRSTLFYIFLAFFFIGLSSCKKKIEEKKQQAAIDDELVKAAALIDLTAELDFSTATSNSASYDLYSESIEAESFEEVSCAEVTFETSPGGAFPKTITINYGDSCGFNGVYRSGVLVITLTDYMLNEGAIITIDHQEFSINGWTINGEIKWTNNNTNPEQPSWLRETYGSTYIAPNGVLYTHDGFRQIKQIEGFGNLDLNDNVYESAEGNYTIVKQNGNLLTLNVVDPLIKAFNCEFTQSGSLSVQGEVLNGIVDYGDGTCDNQAIYTHASGLVFTIDM